MAASFEQLGNNINQAENLAIKENNFRGFLFPEIDTLPLETAIQEKVDALSRDVGIEAAETFSRAMQIIKKANFIDTKSRISCIQKCCQNILYEKDENGILTVKIPGKLPKAIICNDKYDKNFQSPLGREGAFIHKDDKTFYSMSNTIVYGNQKYREENFIKTDDWLAFLKRFGGPNEALSELLHIPLGKVYSQSGKDKAYDQRGLFLWTFNDGQPELRNGSRKTIGCGPQDFATLRMYKN